jgi:hypothetical protein
MKKFQPPLKTQKFNLFLTLLLIHSLTIPAQEPGKHFIKGSLADVNNKPIQFATVALLRLPDSTLITGAASDTSGNFIIGPVNRGTYHLFISAIGYLREDKEIQLEKDFDAGRFYMKEKPVSLDEIIVSSDRTKAHSDVSKITYFINTALSGASYNAADLVSYIPGIQVDLMKNISIRGSRNIIIMVNGRERDRNYLSQLDASLIDKVEINNAPGAQYDAGTSGVINIILKKNRATGISGYITAETPTSKSEIYAFPSYNISYGKGRLSLYTSYNGELTYLNDVETADRLIETSNGKLQISSRQELRQKYWSHRFHYGMDYNFNDNNQLSFYANYNPFSRELDGKIFLDQLENISETKNMSGTRDDKDLNESFFYSIYYKHNFRKPGHYIEFDLSDYHFSAENESTIIFDTTQAIMNTMKPIQNSVTLKTAYVSSLTGKMNLSAGLKARFQNSGDRRNYEFDYHENILAAYSTLAYNSSKYTFSLGIRAEESLSQQKDAFSSELFSALPDAALQYRFAGKHNVKFSYARTVIRPGLYDLNPAVIRDDPFSMRSGSPFLKPELQDNLAITYSGTIKEQFLNFQLFYRKRSDVISTCTFINDSEILETVSANPGKIYASGIEMSGAFKLFGMLTLNPYCNLYHSHYQIYNSIERFNTSSGRQWGMRFAASAVASFKYDISASFLFQYDTPNPDFQGTSFSDPLYFVSLEKAFFKRYRLGIKSGLPFSRNFIYQGSEIQGPGFVSNSEGNIRLSSFPLWLNFRYQFGSGRKVNNSERSKEEIINKQKKGF